MRRKTERKLNKRILCRRILCAVMTAAMLTSFSGCSGSASIHNSINLMEELENCEGQAVQPDGRGGDFVPTEGGEEGAARFKYYALVERCELPREEEDSQGNNSQGNNSQGNQPVILKDADELSAFLDALEYSSVTCDGIPEYMIYVMDYKGDGRSEYSVNIKDHWVWKGSREAALTEENAGRLSSLLENVWEDGKERIPAMKDGYSDDNAQSAGSGDGHLAVMDFGVRMLQESIRQEGAENSKNVLVSPLSVISVLAMTANGAKGETLEQMEDVFGMSVSGLNAYLSAYMQALPEGEKYKLSMANAVWFKDCGQFAVKQDFLRANRDYYGAGLYKAPFDNTTLNEINGWVEDNTDGMIKEILNEISPDSLMYLVNALAFDAEWETIYKENQVWDGRFTREDGTVQQVKMMHSAEYGYLETEQAEGFLKYYADRKYAFAALLPREGVTVAALADSLTGEKLNEALHNPVDVKVNAAIPKFESGYGVLLNQMLQNMGMENAFDAYRADFSGIGSYDGPISDEGVSIFDGPKALYISQILHKTFIAVNERGTRAGAASVVVMDAGAAPPQQEVKTVYLDRPFVYMIVDCDSNLPIFIGVVTDIGK